MYGIPIQRRDGRGTIVHINPNEMGTFLMIKEWAEPSRMKPDNFGNTYYRILKRAFDTIGPEIKWIDIIKPGLRRIATYDEVKKKKGMFTIVGDVDKFRYYIKQNDGEGYRLLCANQLICDFMIDTSKNEIEKECYVELKQKYEDLKTELFPHITNKKQRTA